MPDEPDTEPTEPTDHDSDHPEPAKRPKRPRRPERPERPEPPRGNAASKAPSWPTLVALGVALIAVILAVVAVTGVGGFGPSAGDESVSYTDKQVEDAKNNLCTASLAARQALVRNTKLNNPVPDDPIGKLAVSAHVQLAFSGSGAFLRGKVAEEHAAPEDLSKAVQSLANTLEDLGISFIAGAPNSEHRSQLQASLDPQLKHIGELCS